MSKPQPDEPPFSLDRYAKQMREKDWLYISLMVPGEDGSSVETSFRLLVCPDCGATIPFQPRGSQGINFQEMHVAHHLDLLSTIQGASDLALAIGDRLSGRLP